MGWEFVMSSCEVRYAVTSTDNIITLELYVL